jgi:hypothetical protein
LRLFRRRDETLNDRLLREAGYGPDGAMPAGARRREESAPPAPQGFRPLLPQGDGLPGVFADERRLGGWDMVRAVAAPDLHGSAYEFATVPDGTVIVGESCDEDLSALADAIALPSPYRAVATRLDDRFWLVSARRIQVLTLETAEGNEFELSSLAGKRIFSVDGLPVDDARVPAELAALGERRGADYAVRATRIDGDLWEIEADPL